MVFPIRHRRSLPLQQESPCRLGSAEAEQVPHITVEAYEFSAVRSQGLHGPFAISPQSEDRVSARRILQRPASGVGDATMKRIEDAGRAGFG